MLLQSLRALCLAPGGPGGIWKYLEALLRTTGVSQRFVYGFQTDLHFADVVTWVREYPEQVMDAHVLSGSCLVSEIPNGAPMGYSTCNCSITQGINIFN